MKKIISIFSLTIFIIGVVFIIILNTIIIPDNQYDEAVLLMERGQYEDALSAFEILGDYKDSAEKIFQCNEAIRDGKYNNAIAFMKDKQYMEAISLFESLDGYKDSAAKITECTYQNAVFRMDAGDVIEAYETLISLNGYQDSFEKAKSIYDQYKAEKLRSPEVGDYVFFGTYEQDNNMSNGKEDIEWLVLEVTDGKALLISRYVIDAQSYNYQNEKTYWEESPLREWLNSEFLNGAFSDSEKEKIPIVISTERYKIPDQVFLLSSGEAEKYFDSSSDRQCTATMYAKEKGAAANDGYCAWWLWDYVSTNKKNYHVLDCVYYDGDLDYPLSSHHDIGIRPCIWIDLQT